MTDQLQQQLNHQFTDTSLLEQALTHRSYINEHPEYENSHNERLEYLGDAVLDFVISDMLFNRFQDMTEGRMTRLRAALVRTETLAQLGSDFGLGELLRMARGEEESGGRTRPTNLCNTFEAVIGALYIDAGIDRVFEFIVPLFDPLLDSVMKKAFDKDPKSRFQEWSQGRYGITPVYQTMSAVGEDHDKTFTVEVTLDEKVAGRGVGKSKQSAEQSAASAALNHIDDDESIFD